MSGAGFDPSGASATEESTVSERELDPPRDLDPSRAPVAGAIAGLAGFAAFLVVHHLTIEPIWMIVPAGAPFAAIGGAVAGAAYAEMRPRLPDPAWQPLWIIVAVGLILAPSFVLAQLRGPVFRIVGSQGVLIVPPLDLVPRYVVDLLGTATLVGAALGAVVGRTRRAAAMMAAAGFVFALGPGHNIPLLGGTRGVPKELLLIGSAVVVSSIVLVALDTRLRRRSAVAQAA